MLCTDISMLALSQGGIEAPGDIPADPREWSRQDVTRWLTMASHKYHLLIHTDRFPMNGKGLLLLTPDMLSSRLPEGGGQILYEELQLRLQRAIRDQVRRIDSLLRAGLLAQQ